MENFIRIKSFDEITKKLTLEVRQVDNTQNDIEYDVREMVLDVSSLAPTRKRIIANYKPIDEAEVKL